MRKNVELAHDQMKHNIEIATSQMKQNIEMSTNFMNLMVGSIHSPEVERTKNEMLTMVDRNKDGILASMQRIKDNFVKGIELKMKVTGPTDVN